MTRANMLSQQPLEWSAMILSLPCLALAYLFLFAVPRAAVTDPNQGHVTTGLAVVFLLISAGCLYAKSSRHLRLPRLLVGIGILGALAIMTWGAAGHLFYPAIG